MLTTRLPTGSTELGVLTINSLLVVLELGWVGGPDLIGKLEAEVVQWKHDSLVL